MMHLFKVGDAIEYDTMRNETVRGEVTKLQRHNNTEFISWRVTSQYSRNWPYGLTVLTNAGPLLRARS
jgi:hypothetical protein